LERQVEELQARIDSQETVKPQATRKKKPAKLAALGLAAVTIVALLTKLGYMAPVVA
jgi:hypothetical protein